MDLFEIDMSIMLNNLTHKLSVYFLQRSRSEIEQDKKIQNIVNRWRNLTVYQYIRSDNKIAPAIRTQLNEYFILYHCFLDSSKEKFIKDFPNQCIQNTFELIMAYLISRKFKLIKKTISPDLKFDQYFVECTTIMTSSMDKWDNLLPRFNCFFDVVKIIYDKFILLRKTDYWYFESSICTVWDELFSEEKQVILNKLSFLSVNNEKEIIKNILDWISITRYTCLHFIGILPCGLRDKLKQIEFPIGSTVNQKIDFEFIAKRIAKAIFDKLKLDYFQKNKLGIIAISIAPIMPGPGLSDIDTQTFLNYLYKNLFWIFRCVVQDESKEDKEKAINAQHNLVGILIDTNWYNWFPAILEDYGLVRFPSECKNIYAIVYNDYYYSNIRHEDFLFYPLIEYQLLMPLKDLLLMEKVEEV